MERQSASNSKETSTLILRKIIPHKITIALADKFMGEGLTDEGHSKLKTIVSRILKEEKIQASQDVPPAYVDSQFRFEHDGEENIPNKGTTLFIGNHTKSGPLAGIGQYFEASKIAHDARVDVEDNGKREPRVIAQKGLNKTIKFPGGNRVSVMVPLTESFYELAAKSLDWVVVSVPKFDKNGQITNRQNLPPGVIENLLRGEALFWFPQGKHKEGHDLVMPEKGSGFLNKLKDEDVNIVPTRFMPGNPFKIRFGQSVHIQDIPKDENGQLDVNAFSRNYLVPLAKEEII